MGDEYVAEASPAYNVYPWASSDSGGPQCSQWGEYCYLCQTPEAPECEEEDNGLDYVVQLKSLIRSLVSEGKERGRIVQEVHACYNKNIRPGVRAVNFKTGAAMTSPEWTRQSIDRHLVSVACGVVCVCD